jgi:hypothetical protein
MRLADAFAERLALARIVARDVVGAARGDSSSARRASAISSARNDSSGPLGAAAWVVFERDDVLGDEAAGAGLEVEQVGWQGEVHRVASSPCKGEGWG